MFLQDYLVAWLIQVCQWQNALWFCGCFGIVQHTRQITDKRTDHSRATTALSAYQGRDVSDFHLEMWLRACVHGFFQLSPTTKCCVVGAAIVTVEAVRRVYRRAAPSPRRIPDNERVQQESYEKQETPRKLRTPDTNEATRQVTTVSSDSETVRDVPVSAEQSAACHDEPLAELDDQCQLEEETQQFINGDSSHAAGPSETALGEFLPLMTVNHVVDIHQLYSMLSAQKCEEIDQGVFSIECTSAAGQTEMLRLAVTPLADLNRDAVRNELELLRTIRKMFVGERHPLRRHLPLIREVLAIRDALAKLSLRRTNAHNSVRDYIAILSVYEADVPFSHVARGRASISLLTSILEQANLSMALMRAAMPGIALFHNISLISWPIDVDFSVDDNMIVVPSHGVLVKHCPDLLRLGTSLADLQQLASDILKGADMDGAGDDIEVHYCTKIFFSLGATTPLDKLIHWRNRYFQAINDRLTCDSDANKKYRVSE